MSVPQDSAISAPSERIVLATRIMRLFWPGASAAARSPLILFLYKHLFFGHSISPKNPPQSGNTVKQVMRQCCSHRSLPSSVAEIVHAQSDPRLRYLHSILMAGIQACGTGGKPMTSLRAGCGLRAWYGTESRSHTCILIWVLIGNKR